MKSKVGFQQVYLKYGKEKKSGNLFLNLTIGFVSGARPKMQMITSYALVVTPLMLIVPERNMVFG